jgi:hypothetical protein
MNRQFRNETFQGLFDRGNSLRIEDVAFDGCTFDRSAISLTQDIRKIADVRRVELLNCTASRCNTGPMVISEANISNLKTNDLLILWCPYLDRVRLSGEIGKIKINAAADTSTVGNERQKPFDEYRASFYARVDWALDISSARFQGFDARGVPGRLVRRDPESQILITRERALQIATPGWEQRLDPSNKLWPFMIKLFLQDGDPDTVFVAPLGAPKAKRDPLLKGLQELRLIGLAEPD